MQHDPRDTALAEAVVATVRRLILADTLDAQEAVGQLALLLDAVLRYRAALAERPSDAALRRAVAATGDRHGG